MMEAKDRIIVALDYDNLEAAKPIIEQLLPHLGLFKIGIRLVAAVGISKALECVRQLGGEVFLDGKFNDIPESVAGASKTAVEAGAKMFSVHASSGVEAMKAAVSVKGNSLALAVTVLTSLDIKAVERIFWFHPDVKVSHFAADAKLSGMDGIICSVSALQFLRAYFDVASLIKVIPGIRPQWAPHHDQKIVVTPKAAILAGADYLVLGRPITNPPAKIGMPVDAVKKILEEIASAASTKGR